MRPLSRPAAFAVILALVLALVPATTASATLPVPPSTTHLFAVDFIDANNGWAAGGFFNLGTNYAVVERTTNGGTTWTRTTVQPPLGQIKGISFVSATVGYAVDGEPDHVFKTTDGGATWSEMLVTTDLLKKNNSFIAVRFFDALHGYVAGQNSGTKQAVVWSTSNGGTSWTRALLGPEHLDSEGNPIGDSWFQALEGYDASHVMAVGVDVILSSTPVQTALGYKYNGSTWATQTMPVATTNFFGVAYPDASHGVAVGPSGFAASFNGSSWTAVSSGTSSDLQGAAAADATHAWAVGTGGAIRFWNGSGFASQTSGTSVTLRGVAAASTTAAWAVGDNDTILKTTDGGAHWTPRAAPGDYTAPVTTISGVPAGWTKSNVSFTLTAVDEPGNTITTKYRYNAGDYQIYPGHAVTLAVEGQTLISYYSYDQSSNVEPVKSVTAKVDKSAPVTGISTAADVGSTAVVLYPSDTYSGVAATYHTVDGGAPQTGTAFVLSTLGDHIVTWYSTDNAGNVETVHSDVVNVANVGIDPIAGDNRYETAVLAVERAFPTGAGTVVIASGQNFPDALGGSALCGAWGAPLLLTQKDALPTVVRDEIVRLHPSRAIILGSTSAVSAATAQLISPLVGGNVQRIGGIHRYDTAAQVATATMSKLATSSVPDVFLAVGDNFPDALAASPAAYDKKWPILLTTRTGLPPQTLAALAALKPARVHVLGSPATVPDAVLGQLPAGITADRWAGTTRYGTAVDVANKSGLPFTGIAIATGQNFPDALAGGVMQGKLGGPVLLTPTAYLATETSAAIAAHKAQITAVRYLGSTTAVSDAVRTSIGNLLNWGTTRLDGGRPGTNGAASARRGVRYDSGMATPLLTARALRATRDTEAGTHVVLDGVDLDVEAGTLTDVVGPSGAGKTTLLLALARLLPHATGELALHGVAAERVPPQLWRREVALLPQVPALVPGTVGENLLLPWRLKTRAREHPPSAEALERALAEVGLADVALARDPARLSVGQIARVALLRVLLTRPRVLLADEPDAALDDESAAQVTRMTAAFVAAGGAVVRVRHLRLDERADRRYRLAEGRLEEVDA